MLRQQIQPDSDSMNSVSATSIQNATTKSNKVRRTQPAIARKIIAFQELINLDRKKKSAREAADILEIPNSTMQSWREQKISQKGPIELKEFFSTAAGADFLQRTVLAVMKLMKCGSSGIRGMQEFLHNSGLDIFVASSEGALQKFWSRCEICILEFGECEEKRLALGMRYRKITVALDEMFRSHRPCLVAIEVVSNYILLEKFTEDRSGKTWVKELSPRIKDVNIELSQVVSDCCGGIQSCAKALEAVHIPELFHAQYEISKATSALLASQERTAEKALNKAEEDYKRIKEERRRFGNEYKQQKRCEVKKLIKKRYCLKSTHKKKKKYREEVREAIREMGKIHHPIDLSTGKLQTAAGIENRFNEQFKIIREHAEEARLPESSFNRIEKARRAFDAIVRYVKYFFVVYAAFIADLKLSPEQEIFFNEVIFPLCYLKLIWRRLPKKSREEYEQLLRSLEIRIQEIPWSEECGKELMKKGKELAETFQRSSSCVEGRNGGLSLNHHRFHRLNERSLKVLTIVHNFDIRRSDGTTAAERFFETKHENLFNTLVEKVRIPGRPQQQHHDLQKRRLGREKRLAA